MSIKASEIREIIAHFKEKPIFVDLKGRFLSSVVSSISEKEMEGFLIIRKDDNLYLFFLSSGAWDKGFELAGENLTACDPDNIEDICLIEGVSASFYQGRIMILDILLGRYSNSSLLTEASMVNASILPMLIEGAEKDRLTAYYRLKWSQGTHGYILMKDGEIFQRFFFSDKVYAGDEAGKKIFSLLDQYACDVSIYEISSSYEEKKASYKPQAKEKPEEIRPSRFTAPAAEKEIYVDSPRKTTKMESFMPQIPTGKAEPLHFSSQYSEKFEDDYIKEAEEEPFGTKVLGSFSSILKKSPQKPEEDKKESEGGPISRYLFPIFNKKPSDKIIKPITDSEVIARVEEEDINEPSKKLPPVNPAGVSPKMSHIKSETEPDKDSFKSHILTSYFSLAQTYENDGNMEKTFSVLEEALEVPQIDKLSVYRYILFVCRKNDAMEQELSFLRRMAEEYRYDTQLLAWINRQIALIYVKKNQFGQSEKEKPEPEIIREKGSIFSRLLGKKK